MNLKRILENERIKLKFRKINPNKIFQEELSQMSITPKQQRQFKEYEIDKRGVHPLFNEYLFAFKKVDKILINLPWEDAREYISLMKKETKKAFYFATLEGVWKCKEPSPYIEMGHE